MARPTSWAGTSAQPDAAERVLDLLAEQGQIVLGDRPALAGLADAGDRLVAAERLGRAGPLHHRELHLLDGGEPLLAVAAGAAAADRRAVVGDAGVEHPGVGVGQYGQCIRVPPSGLVAVAITVCSTGAIRQFSVLGSGASWGPSCGRPGDEPGCPVGSCGM